MRNLTYRIFLNDALKLRQLKNPNYSLRAYARDLGISTAHLSEVLNGKSHLSPDRASKLVLKLGLSEVDQETFIDLVEVEAPGDSPAKRRAKQRLSSKFMELKVLSEGAFTPISEWYFLPLLELIPISPQPHSMEHFASRLGLSTAKVEAALEVLVQNGFISQCDGNFVVNDPALTTTNEIPSTTIRNYYRTTLQRAENAIEEQTLEQRDFSVANIALSKKKLGMVKERIRQFRRQLALDLAEDAGKDAVYTLSICFFETTKASR